MAHSTSLLVIISLVVLFLLLCFREGQGCFSLKSRTGRGEVTTTPLPITTQDPDKNRGYSLIVVEDEQGRIQNIHVMERDPTAHSQIQEMDAGDLDRLTGPPTPNGGGGGGGNEDPREAQIRRDWGEGCTLDDWNDCSRIIDIFRKGVFNKTKEGTIKPQDLYLTCAGLNITCLKTKWTVNRCQLICMSRCNTDILLLYDKFHDHYGPCNYMIL